MAKPGLNNCSPHPGAGQWPKTKEFDVKSAGSEHHLQPVQLLQDLKEVLINHFGSLPMMIELESQELGLFSSQEPFS
jgi:hypothetical protein